jgi:hypothetical protein
MYFDLKPLERMPLGRPACGEKDNIGMHLEDITFEDVK